MHIDLIGRVALVSGAAQGIGREIGRMLSRCGAKVHLLDRDEPGVQAAAYELRATAHAVDLSDWTAVQGVGRSIYETEGRIDILGLAAGGVCGQVGLSLQHVTKENWNRIFEANLDSILWLAQFAAPFMVKQGWGRIVTISSGAGLRPSRTGLHAYTSAKHAVIGLTRQLSAELGPHGVTVNSVAPGLVLSAPAPLRQWEKLSEAEQQRLLEGLHTRRLVDAVDIAAAAMFLMSEQARSITGQVLSVDGGR